MELVILTLKTILFVLVGLGLSVLAIRFSPVLFKVDVLKEIKASNQSAAIFALAIFILIGLIIGFTAQGAY